MRQAAIVMPAPLRSTRSRRAGLATRDFDRVYRDPTRRLRSRHFLVLVRRREQGPGVMNARWGISVKARLGSAIVRNRIKRRLREILRAGALPPAWDIVIQPRSAGVATADFAALRRELEALLRGAVTDKA